MYRFVCKVPGRGIAFIIEEESIDRLAGFDEDYLIELIRRQLGSDFNLEDLEFYELGDTKPLVFEKTVTYTIYQAV